MSQLRTFLDRLYKGCTDGVLECRALTLGTPGAPAARAWVAPGDWAALGPFLNTQLALRKDLYFGVALRVDASSGRTENLLEASAVWVDFEKSRTALDAVLQSFIFPPSAILASGAGHHLYWWLREFFPLRTATELQRFASVLRRLAETIGGDPRATDPARILRLPQTYNFKYDTPRLVTLETMTDATVDFSELEAELPAAILINNEWTVTGIPKGQRNDQLYRVGRSLQCQGKSLPDIYRELEAVNRQYCQPPLEADEIKKIAKQVVLQPHRPDFTPPIVIHDATPPPPAPDGTAITVNLGTVTPVPIDWHWTGRTAAGRGVLLAGDPGLGKSMLLADIAARYTTGADWPDGGQAPKGKVVFLCAEDDLADTVRPRIDVAGGDPTQIEVLQAVRDGTSDRLFNLSKDLAVLDSVLQRVQPLLLVLDPLNSYVGRIDSYRDADVRSVLSPLLALVMRYRCALIWVAHLTKASEAKALYRSNASVAFIASSRCAFVLGEHAENPGLLVLAQSKTNSIKVPSLGFRIVDSALKDIGKVVWEGVVDQTADQILRVRDVDDLELGPTADEVISQLRAEAETGSIDVKDANAHAALLGVPERTLRHAARRAGLTPYSKGKGREHRGYWLDPAHPSHVTSNTGNAGPTSGIADIAGIEGNPNDGNTGNAGSRESVAGIGDSTRSPGIADIADIASTVRATPYPN